MFYFNADKFGFWKIYDSIKRFYPIGIKKDNNGMYFSYPGIKELKAILTDQVHDENNFNTCWISFEEVLSKKTGKEIIGTTYAYAPCFSGYILLQKNTSNQLTIEKELHFFLSLAGPYYTVLGMEHITGRAGDHLFRSTAYLVVSPENEFAEIFEVVCHEIESRFTGYQFVPFAICKWVIEGLDVFYGNAELNTVFNALFNDQVNLNTECIIGNDYYKSEDWRNQEYVNERGKWTMYPPTVNKE